MAGEHLKNYKGPRGRINKDDLLGFAVSDMVEFVLPESGEYAYGKIIEFKRKTRGILAEISVKALQQPDDSWLRYPDYFDFKLILLSELSAAPKGVLKERTRLPKRKVVPYGR